MSTARNMVDDYERELTRDFQRRLEEREVQLREEIAMRDRRVAALEKQCNLLANEVDRLNGPHAADDSFFSGSLTLAQISQTNLERALIWHKGGLEEWSVSDWGCAMGGEDGEVLDAIKKLRRIEEHVPSENVKQPPNRDAAVKAIAQEIGDTFVYLDLLAQRLGLNVEDCIRDTFNRISDREHLPQRL